MVDNPLNFEPTNPVVTTSSVPENYFSFDIDRKNYFILFDLSVSSIYWIRGFKE